MQIVINAQTDQWGTSRDPSRDIATVPMEVNVAPLPREAFTIELVEITGGAELRMSWATFEWSVPIVVH